MHKSFTAVLGVTLCAAIVASAAPNGVYNDSPSARGMALGGNGTAASESPLEALSSNPAALGEISKTTVNAGLDTGFVDGTFHNSANRGGADFSETGVLPTGAIAVPVGPLRFGLGVYSMSNLQADWQYRDARGGLGGATTYGVRTQKSELELLRIPVGVAWKINDTVSIGVSASALYNKNRLDAPYVFQTQPTLRGAKTLLNLQTEGWGWDVQAGVLWKPLANLKLAASYATDARIRTSGTASGNAGTQLQNIGLGAARPDFNYDAEVTNTFPQTASVGLVWQAAPRLAVDAQVDWLNWRDSFRSLPVHLSSGNNADLNGLVGSNRLTDNVPLDWHDQFVWRLGLEYEVSSDWTLRAGYAYAPNPVPGTTLTPLTAAIAEHTVSAGFGFHRGRYTLDAAWQWALPIEAHVGKSDLLSGEYSESSVKISSQWLALTAEMQF